MKLRKELLGIILAFSFSGVVANSVNANAYQKVYDQQAKQEQKINKLLKSEFITDDGQSDLQKNLTAFDQAKDSKNKRSLLALIAKGDKQLATVQKELKAAEVQAIKEELAHLQTTIQSLQKKSQEAFILQADQQQITKISGKYDELATSTKIQPIRSLSKAAASLAEQVADHQKQLLALVDKLKEDNQITDSLLKKNYLSAEDKHKLTENQKENRQFFEDAQAQQAVEKRQQASAELIEKITQKQQATENEFKDYESQAKSLLADCQALSSAGELSSEETNELAAVQKNLEATLALKSYQPGDLKDHFNTLKSKYTSVKKNSDKRIADKKQQAEAAKAERERQQEQTKAAENNNQANNSQVAPSPSLVGGWYQAPPGYKFLKESSGNTYGQVKIPSNFTLITDAEAQKYTPGHGNGSAKQ